MSAATLRIDALAEKLLRGVLHAAGSVDKSLLEKAGARLGRWMYLSARRHRRIARQNVARSFPLWSAEQHEKIVQGVFANLGKNLLEIGWSTRLSPDRFADYIHIEGAEHIHKARRQGKGILFFTAHMGNWELAPLFYALLGVPGSVVYRPLDEPFLERLVADLRSRYGLELIPNKRAMRPILKSLRRNRMVSLLMDQNVDWYEGVFVDFFGRSACTSKGLALLALKSEAPVIPGFIFRRNGYFQVRILKEVPLIRTGDRTRDIELNTQQYARVIEDIIRTAPDQWFWVHQRWKTRPSQPWPRKTNASP